MERKEALQNLLERVKAGDIPDTGVDRFSAIPQRGFGVYSDQNWYDANAAYWCCSLDAAKALHEAVLPGWGWRICQCYLSDDAAVFPDFNCPEHGDRLKRQLDESVDWFDLTDVDQRPAGNPARAWLIAILKSLIEQEPS